MPQEPSIPEVIRLGIKQALAAFHVGLPAKVISFDAAKRTCKVQPLLRRALRDVETKEVKVESYPQILNVPVQYQRGGGWSIRFPLKPDDIVYLTFADRAMESYLGSDECDEVDPEETRRHDLNDAIAVPAPVLPTRSSNPEVRDDSLVIGKDDGSIEIELTQSEVNITGDNVNINAGGNADAAMVRFEELKQELDALKLSLDGHMHTFVGMGTVGVPAPGTFQPFSEAWKSQNGKVK